MTEHKIELQNWSARRMALVCLTCESTLRMWNQTSIPLDTWPIGELYQINQAIEEHMAETR